MRHHFLACLPLVSACASTVASTDAAVSPDVVSTDVASADVASRDVIVPTDAPPCRWTVGDPVVLRPPTADGATRTLRDARPSSDGVWVVATDDGDTVLERLDPRGHRLGFARLLAGLAPASASLALNDARARRAVIVQSPMGTCQWIALAADGAPGAPVQVEFPNGGFSLTGCHALAVNDAGYTFLAEQVRALWGVSLVQLDARGATPSQQPPNILDGYPPVAFARDALPDQRFAFASFGQRMPRAGTSVQAQVFGARGEDAGAPQTVRSDAGFVGDQGLIVATDAGLVVAWVESPSGVPSSPQVWLRALDRAAAPTGPAWSPSMFRAYQGGLAATFTHGALLLTSVAGSGVLRPWVAVLSPSDAGEVANLALPMPDGAVQVGDVRIAATAEGALALYTADVGRANPALVAAPIRCAP